MYRLPVRRIFNRHFLNPVFTLFNKLCAQVPSKKSPVAVGESHRYHVFVQDSTLFILMRICLETAKWRWDCENIQKAPTCAVGDFQLLCCVDIYILSVRVCLCSSISLLIAAVSAVNDNVWCYWKDWACRAVFKWSSEL